MTCIAGAIDEDGTVWMGGDSGVNCGDSSLETRFPKVFRNGPFLIGVTGTSRVSQLVHHVFDPPEVTGDLDCYFVKNFACALRDCMQKDGGECKNQEDDGPETIMDGRCLVGYQGHLFGIDHGYGVTAVTAPYQATGSAATEARAAMFTARALLPKLGARDLVHCALSAAVEFDREIRPPFTILSLRNEA